MIRLPSIQKNYHAFFSDDDALVQPPPHPGEDADESALADWETAVSEHTAKVRSARRTGDLSALKSGTAEPVKFVMRPMPFEGHAVINGMLQRKEPAEDVILLAAQLCLVEIEGVKIKVDAQEHERFGKIAALSTFEKFGSSQGLRIAFELGTLAIQRASADPLG